MSTFWLVPLGIGAAGAAALAVAARRLARAAKEVERRMQPLRADRAGANSPIDQR